VVVVVVVVAVVGWGGVWKQVGPVWCAGCDGCGGGAGLVFIQNTHQPPLWSG